MVRVRLSLQYPALEAGVRALLSQDPQIKVSETGEAPLHPRDSETADVHIMTSAVFAHGEATWGDQAEAIVVIGASDRDVRRLWASSIPWGVVPMEVPTEELCAAVHAVAAGLIVGERPLFRGSDENTDAGVGKLTDREVEVLAMLSGGLANKQIAVELGISEHTVKFHVSSIYAKLNVANRTEAVREGLRNGWIAL